MKKIVGIILIFVCVSIYASDNVLGVWDWHTTENRDVREAKVLFREDNSAIYKVCGVEPVLAKWEIKGDTIMVTSDKFIWDAKFEQEFPFEYQQWYDSIYSPYERGKLLESPGETETYLLKDTLLIPNNHFEKGWLKKSSTDSSDFKDYIPGAKTYICILNGLPPSHYHDIQLNAQSKHKPVKSDSLLTKSLRFSQFSDRQKQRGLLENLPQNIDSIEFKLIDIGGLYDVYFAIDRKAFDKTFDYLVENQAEHNYEIMHIMTKDKQIISWYCELIKESVPYPSEAVQITPNNAWRQSRGDSAENRGIYTNRLHNNDPLEVRGKIVIYYNVGQIVCFVSKLSLDFKSHRYEQSYGHARFLYHLNYPETVGFDKIYH